MPLDRIKQCIENKKSFVLQGGAGSGKTETLKEVLEFISENYPDKKVACITHTNKAVDEIKSRVGNQYTISTIHSFLNSIIKDYKKNIVQCIFEIFMVKHIERDDIEFYNGDEKEQKKQEHEKYKKAYEKYAKKLFIVREESTDNVKGKREYDKNPQAYNTNLNTNIDTLNQMIKDEIATEDCNKVKYNETQFNNYKDLTFGHDGLLEVAYQLFSTFSKIAKILQDQFDYIFIDEYQDTNPKIIKLFLENLPQKDKTVIGLFGDAMQSIYEDGIGNVQNYVDDGNLIPIPKEDNYRCSEQVVKFINSVRNDDINQKVELKHTEKSLDERQGSVSFYYSIVDSKPTQYSPLEIRNEHIDNINQLIYYAKDKQPNSKLLMLTNKSIAIKAGFQKLYEVFDKRYREPKEHLEKVLTILQLLELVELCQSYQDKKYNYILSQLKKVGYPIKTILDKQKLKDNIENLLGFDGTAIEAIQYAFDNHLIKKSEPHVSYLNRRKVFLDEVDKNEEYQRFKSDYLDEKHTFSKMIKAGITIEKEVFNELEKEFKKEQFYIELFSSVPFQEVINYYQYMNEELDYITMHKTKGSGIENVIVVLDEYFWSKYDFNNIFDKNDRSGKKIATQKLFYVACSRTEKNLACVKLITQDEESLITNFFSNSRHVDLANILRKAKQI